MGEGIGDTNQEQNLNDGICFVLQLTFSCQSRNRVHAAPIIDRLEQGGWRKLLPEIGTRMDRP